MFSIQLYLFTLLVYICYGEISDYTNHPCIRPCDGKRMTCYYEFTLERMFSMETFNCGNCLTTSFSDCLNPNCVVVDGKKKFIYTINRNIPGPQIEVCQGDTIKVLLKNKLVDASTTIHWHGQHQRKTPYMDGVPMITQCPIQPGTTFLYEFEATQEGTHFYHSHSGFQRSDGISGSLIVKVPDANNKIRDLYDHDLSSHVIQVTDWLLEDTMKGFYTTYREKVLGSLNSAILINGFGSTTQNSVPVPIFKVKKGFRYRFRLIHSGSTSCPIQVSIDDHILTVVSVDGNDITPQPVDIITITDGERFDFILSANKDNDYYWLRASGGSQCSGLESLALIGYKSDNITIPPLKDADTFIPDPQRTQMNCVNVPSNASNCYTMARISSFDEMDKKLSGTPNFKYVVGYRMYPETLSYFQDLNPLLMNTPGFNNISNIMPSTNLLQPEYTVPFCNRENLVTNDDEILYECTHVVEIPINSLVEIILVNEQPGTVVHPLHLHGYNFRIIAHESLGRAITVKEVEELDRKGLLVRNFTRPVMKDTISVPNGGYSIIRFHADNPGVWFFHCHLEFHVEIGMSMTFKVGNPPKSPSNFPRCGDYTEIKFKKS